MQQSSGIATHRQAGGKITRRARALTLALGMTLPGLAFLPGAASASQAPADNCVVQLNRGSSAPGTTKCFGTFTEAIRFASGGTINNAPASAAEAAKSPAFAAALTNSQKSAGAASAGSQKSPGAKRTAAATGIIIGIEYDDANFGPGASLTFFGTVACTGPTTDVDYQVDLPSVWWDRISSFQTFNVCWANHYYLQNYGGQATGYMGSQAVMPIVGGINFNNNARSIKWS